MIDHSQVTLGWWCIIREWRAYDKTEAFIEVKQGEYGLYFNHPDFGPNFNTKISAAKFLYPIPDPETCKDLKSG